MKKVLAAGLEGSPVFLVVNACVDMGLHPSLSVGGVPVREMGPLSESDNISAS